jgi:hypothetical protein
VPGPTTPTPAEMPYTSFADIEQRVWLQELREALRKANVPDATADQVVQLQRQRAAYVGPVVSKYITGTTTTFNVQGWFIKNGRVADRGVFVGFSFPPNDPKYLAEFVGALNYPHLMVSIYIQDIPGLIPNYAVIDWMEVYPAWEVYNYVPDPDPKDIHSYDYLVAPWDERVVKIKQYWNVVKIEK